MRLINRKPTVTRVYEVSETRAKSISKALLARHNCFVRYLGRYGYEEKNVTTTTATYRLIRKHEHDTTYLWEVTRGTN
jgi:hypothetical protein